MGDDEVAGELESQAMTTTTVTLLICAPWLSWLQRPTVTNWQSEGREFEPHWGSIFLMDSQNLRSCPDAIDIASFAEGGSRPCIEHVRCAVAGTDVHGLHPSLRCGSDAHSDTTVNPDESTTLYGPRHRGTTLRELAPPTSPHVRGHH